jgi:hypothetical protein
VFTLLELLLLVDTALFCEVRGAALDCVRDPLFVATDLVLLFVVRVVGLVVLGVLLRTLFPDLEDAVGRCLGVVATVGLPRCVSLRLEITARLFVLLLDVVVAVPLCAPLRLVDCATRPFLLDVFALDVLRAEVLFLLVVVVLARLATRPVFALVKRALLRSTLSRLPLL